MKNAEIITVQMGQCGNQLGTQFWDTIFQEHHVNPSSGMYNANKDDEVKSMDNMEEDMGRANVYLNSTKGKQGEDVWGPRTLCVDLDSSTLDNVRASSMGARFTLDNFISGPSSSGSNFGAGHYLAGSEMIDVMMDRIRVEVEACDCPSGFQLLHSIGGGTGSGLGTFLLIRMRDMYPDRLIQSHTVFPSDCTSDNVVEPYNATLATHQLIENTDMVGVYDNESVMSFAKLAGNNNSSFANLNKIIAQTIADVTASIRFPTRINSNLRKILTNLINYPRQHFLVPSLAPLPNTGILESFQLSDSRTKLTVENITRAAFTFDHFLANVPPQKGEFQSCLFAYRGSAVSTCEVEYALRNLEESESNLFGSHKLYTPHHHLHASISKRAPLNSDMSCTMLANTHALRYKFRHLTDHFHALYRRKAFLHPYLEVGMDEMEFQEADKNVRDFITEITPWSGCHGPYYESDEEEDYSDI